MFHAEDDVGPQKEATSPLPRLATTTFVVLFLINMLDYVDRWALSGVLTDVQKDLKIDDALAGSLNAYFLISYSVFSPFMGYFGDRFRRTRLLALGIGVWSIATIGTGMATDFNHLRIARSVLGIGEATYGVLAPTILMDLYPRARRSRVLSTFYLAMPIGYALGVILGGQIAKATGHWQYAFFVVGVPGMIAAIGALFLPEPVRGLSEGIDPDRLKAHEKAGPSKEDYRDLLVNSSFTYAVFGLAAYTFAFGGLAYWLPSYMERVKGIPKTQAGLMIALTGLTAAIVGMSCGGWLADRLSKKSPKALFYVSGASILLAIPAIMLALHSNWTPAIVIWLFISQALMLANTGPTNAVIANVVAPNMRATAYAITTFAIHILGDVWSPMLMGSVSIYCGRADVMATDLGKLLNTLGAHAIDGKNLGAGMLIVVPTLLLGGGVLLAGARHLPREMALMLARLKAAPTHGPHPLIDQTIDTLSSKDS